MKVAFIGIVIVLVFLFAPVSYASECLICHGVMKGSIVNTKGARVDVHVEAAAFEGSVHGGFECTSCHVTFVEGTHRPPKAALDKDIAALVPYVSRKAAIDPVALAACDNCHPEIYRQFKGGVHGKNIFEKGQADAPLCLDCHGNPHYIVPAEAGGSPVSHSNVLATCGSCHADEKLAKKYGMAAHVIEKYKESFHGKKYILGHKKAPVCNDCHGAHRITAAGAPDSPVMGTALVKTCGRCHKGATAKFAAAPAHKYLGKENPIPYYGEKLLILLVFGVFGFTISHVLLESWAEIREHLHPKRKEDSGDDE